MAAKKSDAWGVALQVYERTSAAASGVTSKHYNEGNPLRLFIWPHAGGAPVFYRDWINKLPSWILPIIVNYTGRGKRLMDDNIKGMDGMIDNLLPVPFIPFPFHVPPSFMAHMPYCCV
jgi:hypothetical protein